MLMQKKIPYPVIVGLLLLMLIVSWQACARDRMTPIPRPAPVPPFHLRDLNETFHHLSDYRGRVVIVNFWASWCGPCREELPSLNRAWAALKEEGIAMLAINVGEDKEAVEAFIEDYPIDFPVLQDSHGNISQRWRVRGLPATFVINQRGEAVYQVIGDREWDDSALLQQVRELQKVVVRHGP